jgi:hypothetical protein
MTSDAAKPPGQYMSGPSFHGGGTGSPPDHVRSRSPKSFGQQIIREPAPQRYDPAVEKLYHGPGGNPVTLELTTVKATMTVAQLAATFAGMGDEEQAQFFAEMAKAFQQFDGLGGDWQAMEIGKYLGKKSPQAVELLKTILETASEVLVKDVMES